MLFRSMVVIDKLTHVSLNLGRGMWSIRWPQVRCLPGVPFALVTPSLAPTIDAGQKSGARRRARMEVGGLSRCEWERQTFETDAIVGKHYLSARKTRKGLYQVCCYAVLFINSKK